MHPERTVIDPSEIIQFSWSPVGSVQYGYNLIIYEAGGSTPVFSSGLTVSATPLHNLTANTLSPFKTYTWGVDVYKDGVNAIASDILVLTTSIKPVISIDTLPTSSQSFEFEMSYTIYGGTDVLKYRYILYDENDIVVGDSDFIYNYTTKYTFSGFIKNKLYSIKGILYDTNGLYTETPIYDFVVDYSIYFTTEDIVVTTDDDSAKMDIQWKKVLDLEGVYSATPTYVTGKYGDGILVESGETLTFQGMYAIPDSTITFYSKLETQSATPILDIDDGYLRVYAQNNRLKYVYYDGYYAESSLILSPNVCNIGNFCNVGNYVQANPVFGQWTKIAISYGRMVIQSDTYQEIVTGGSY